MSESCTSATKIVSFKFNTMYVRIVAIYRDRDKKKRQNTLIETDAAHPGNSTMKLQRGMNYTYYLAVAYI